MEEIEYKLSQNNAILVGQAVSKLVEIIKTKKSSIDTNDKNFSDLNIPELQYLKSKCGVEEAIVSITASHGIVSLVEEGILAIESALSDLMISLSSAKSPTGITMAIGNLLLLGIRRELELNKTYKCLFNMKKPQHPLITLLSQNYDIWRDIFNQIQLFIYHYDDKIARHSVELLRSVFFYVLCDPNSKLQDTARRQLWNLLILKDNALEAKVLTFEILGWIQNNTQQRCLILHDFVLESCIFTMKSNKTETCSSLLLYLTSIMHKLVKYGCDPNPSIVAIIDLLEVPSTVNTHSCLLIILAETIIISPPIYLIELVRLCKKIIFKQSSNIYAVKCVVSSLLQWFLSPAKLLTESLKVANEIINFTMKNNTYTSITGSLLQDIYIPFVQYSDPHIDLVIKLNIMMEQWQTNERYLSEWLDHVLNASIEFVSKIFSLMSSIFIQRHKNQEITKKSLDILLRFINNSKELSYNVMVMILYKLAHETEPELQLALLKALPLTAVSKQNIPLIVNTLETIKNGPMHLKSLAFNLYLSLWTVEVRCFPYLQKLLLDTNDNWEFNIAKAHTLKEICNKRPELHGKEMVGHLSQILNKCNNEKGSAASALALEGIKILCEEGIVDIISTWRSISPKFVKDKRPIVLKMLCEFLSAYANLQSVTVKNEENINEVILKLWYYVNYSEHVEVIEAALNALACFDPEQITLKLLPDLYRQNLKLPATYAKTPVDVARKPEDVLPYVPGECWVQLMQKMNHDAMDAAGNMLIEWIRIEIASYKSGVYATKESNKSEPVNYDYLAAKSVVRALGNYLRLSTIVDSKVPFSENVVRQCLRVLGESYTKPLPPLDWTFLNCFMTRGAEISRLTINMACKQILISPSARKFIENFIVDFKPSVDGVNNIKILFSNMNYLCKGIAPNSLRSLVAGSLNFSYKLFLNNNSLDDELFNSIIISLKDTLLDQDIHEANRTLLGQIIETFTEEISVTTELFEIFLQCAIEIPIKHFDRISSPSLWWAITDEKYEKAIKIRCYYAKKIKNKPFVALNECINTAATLPGVQKSTLRNITGVFRHHVQHPFVADWILELMGQIQEKLTNNVKDACEITFLCDVFLVAIIVFSGYECLNCPVDMVATVNELRLNSFPSAVFHFLNNDKYRSITLQVLEWLYHMIEMCTEISTNYQLIFYQALVMLRHEKSFSESTRWMKYLSIKRPISN